MSNYPPGAANDPSAPYNQKDSDYWHEDKESCECAYCDKQNVAVDNDNCCEKCFNDHRESW